MASVVGSQLAGAIGSLATTPNIPSWYAGLDKPPLVPPNEVFGPVWITLYTLMGIALALIITEPTPLSKARAYWCYGLQLTLNTIWSLVFFGLRAPEAGIAIILLLLTSIVMTMCAFYPIKKPAAWLLLPYIAWVSFATYLTIGIAVLN